MVARHSFFLEGEGGVHLTRSPLNPVVFSFYGVAGQQIRATNKGTAVGQMSDSGEGEPPHDEYHCPDGKSPSVGEWTGNDGSPSDADVAKPAPTRKRNLYVTVACASCKKAHVACDESRPCKYAKKEKIMLSFLSFFVITKEHR